MVLRDLISKPYKIRKEGSNMNDSQRDELLIRVDERQDHMLTMITDYHGTMKSHLLDHKIFKSKITWCFICPILVACIVAGIIALA
jgi:hypothetical protein